MATVIYGDFEWDDAKAASNVAKHEVSFEEAAHALVEDAAALDLGDALDPSRVNIVGDVAGRAYPLCGFHRSRPTPPDHQRAPRDQT